MGGVYIISDENECVKIGVAGDLKNRLSSIQTGNSHKVTVEGVVPLGKKEVRNNLEKHLHQTFNDKRIKGEWFQVSMLDIMLELRKLGLHKKVTLI